MRVLIVHNRYRQAGGEDAVVRDEAALLRGQWDTAGGHGMHGQEGSAAPLEVELFECSNDALREQAPLAAAANTLWSRAGAAAVAAAVRAFRPEVVHVHNTFAMLSPSIYRAVRQARPAAAVVQTLHNFRLMCVGALLLRAGRVCEDCVGRLPWRGVWHACYRDSRAASATVAGMQVLHRALGTWTRGVDRYIALTEFCRGRFIAAGLPAERMVVKLNFVALPAPPTQARSGILFACRLAPEKGVGLLQAAARAGHVIDVAGSGPLAAELAGVPGLNCLGTLDAAALQERMRRAALLLLPSLWYEQFPRVLIEAWACGLPVLASRLGAFAELVREGDTGLLFTPGDGADLVRQLDWARDHPAALARMGAAGRAEVERHYGPARNRAQLLAIYGAAIAERRAT